ncbi:MAG TPA: LysE family transporter [Candidatus Phascolarctobacterium stercoravium]|nr:LysE family transporter [Candidatus Phascolarctobacterium stercoravium]
MELYLQGLTLGLAYVAPIGMQNLFVINSALAQNRMRALITALIVIFFDVTLAMACFFGIGLVMQKYAAVQMAVLLISGLIVTYIGIGLIKSSAQALADVKVSAGIKHTIWQACVVTWFNAQAVIDGTMLLGVFKSTMTQAESLNFLFGVLSASCLWFTGLALIVSLAGNLITPRVLNIINKICGAVIILYGLKLLRHFALLFY